MLNYELRIVLNKTYVHTYACSYALKIHVHAYISSILNAIKSE